MGIKIIAAIGKNRELGSKGQLLWHIPADLAHFKQVTMGHPILMGRKTFDSLPNLLPGRTHYVVTRDPKKISKKALPQSYRERDTSSTEKSLVVPVTDLDTFIKDHCSHLNEDIYVIGGGEIYEATLPYADMLYLTEVNMSYPEADTFFPDFDSSGFIRDVIQKGESNGLEYTIYRYTKK